MAANARPFITCHVLDTVAGRPGANISVELQLLSPNPGKICTTKPYWTAKTNSDGRVAEWTTPVKDCPTVNEIIQMTVNDPPEDWDGEILLWELTFDTESYYGKGNTFWPEVKLRFATKKSEEHYHVPLLLGPWSYTTYRGS